MSMSSPGASPGSPIALTPATLPEFLLAVAPVRPVYIKGPPAEPAGIRPPHRELAHAAKALLRSLAAISLEIAQGVVAADKDDRGIPGWFLAEVVRDLPRLAAQAR